MIVRGVSWVGLAPGEFHSPWFKTDHALLVIGHRGDWTWQVEHRPHHSAFAPTTVKKGKTRTKVEAMVAAIDALREIVRGNNAEPPADTDRVA